MKGIVLAGGTGSRLYPLTKVTNKHLLPVGREPMIFHPIKKLIEAGIEDILIVTGVDHMGDVVSLLGSGKEFGCSFTYKVQDQAGGIAQALGLSRNFCGQDKMVVLLGDNIFNASIADSVQCFQSSQAAAKLLLKEVHDPERYGVATLSGEKILSIIEKPKKPESNLAVTGIYMYNSEVFNAISYCSPSQRGELEISDVNQYFVNAGRCEYEILQGWWTDAGTFSSLKKANELLDV